MQFLTRFNYLLQRSVPHIHSHTNVLPIPNAFSCVCFRCRGSVSLGTPTCEELCKRFASVSDSRSVFVTSGLDRVSSSKRHWTRLCVDTATHLHRQNRARRFATLYLIQLAFFAHRAFKGNMRECGYKYNATLETVGNPLTKCSQLYA